MTQQIRTIKYFNSASCLSFITMSILFLLCSGCSSLLPVVEARIETPWDSYEQAKQAFDKIIPYQTSEEELQSLNFTPFLNPNVAIVTYLELINRFMPSSSFQKGDLPKGIQDCIENNNLCSCYELKISQLQSKRFGNVFLDLFDFKRETHKTGWEFNALIVLVNNHVVYKLWSGKPKIDEFSYKKNPLGPLQESEILIAPVGKALL